MAIVGDVKIIPESLEYNFKVMKHTAKATLEHVAGVRRVSYFFDDKLISEKVVPDGDLLTDDDCVADIIHEYTRTNTGVYADLISNHSDKITLLNKKLKTTIESGMFIVQFASVSEKGVISFSMTANDGKDKIECTMEAKDFAEAFEKSRFLLYGMESINGEITKHINELANDKIMEMIKW